MNAIPLTRPAADCQVLVVGAGPTGLVLAAELLAPGIRTRIIDKGDGVTLPSCAVAGTSWSFPRLTCPAC